MSRVYSASALETCGGTPKSSFGIPETVVHTPGRGTTSEKDGRFSLSRLIIHLEAVDVGSPIGSRRVHQAAAVAALADFPGKDRTKLYAAISESNNCPGVPSKECGGTPVGSGHGVAGEGVCVSVRRNSGVPRSPFLGAGVQWQHS